jgi:hypothetical protein
VAKTRVFISFDYDHDLDLKNLLVGQAKNPDSPFEIADWSVKTASPTWKEEARRRIRASDVVAVICGEHTHTATGVGVELAIAQEEGVSYFLLWGRTGKTCTKPTTAKSSDQIYKWTWDNLKSLIGGAR